MPTRDIQTFTSTLRGCFLFSHISDSQILAVAGCSSLRTYKKNEYLFHAGDPIHGFYVVQSGAINLHQISHDGKEQIISIIHPGQSFAEIAMTEEPPTFPVHASALENSAVILVDRQSFRRTAHQHPDLALCMLTGMSLHLKELVSRLEQLRFNQIEARLAHWLLANRQGPPGGQHAFVEIKPSKKILASELGVAPETLSRTLASFADLGLIRMESRTIHLLDLARLESLE